MSLRTPNDLFGQSAVVTEFTCLDVEVARRKELLDRLDVLLSSQRVRDAWFDSPDVVPDDVQAKIATVEMLVLELLRSLSNYLTRHVGRRGVTTDLHIAIQPEESVRQALHRTLRENNLSHYAHELCP